jgi:hypothetical protein
MPSYEARFAAGLLSPAVLKVDGRIEKGWQSNVETGTPIIKKKRLKKVH